VPTLSASPRNPFPNYTKGHEHGACRCVFKEYDALAEKKKVESGIGPAMLNAGGPAKTKRLLARSEALRSETYPLQHCVAGEGRRAGKRWAAAARASKTGSTKRKHSQGNFNLGAMAWMPPRSRFSPPEYHTGFGPNSRWDWNPPNIVAARSKTRRSGGG